MGKSDFTNSDGGSTFNATSKVVAQFLIWNTEGSRSHSLFSLIFLFIILFESGPKIALLLTTVAFHL